MKEHYDFSKGKRGAIADADNKTRITIHLDTKIVNAFRKRASAEGKGYQTLINEALKQIIQENVEPVTVKVLRRVIREELEDMHT